MQVRISEWLPTRADGQGLNNYVLPYEQRADKEAWPIGADRVIWRVKDAFTVWGLHGGWDPAPYKWTIPQWARDSYLKPVNDPHYCGHTDQDFVLGLLDAGGNFMPGGAGMLYWWYEALTAPTAQSPADKFVMKQLGATGWTTMNMSNDSTLHWELGQCGPYKACKVGASDIWVGPGMPAPNEHVAFMVVFQAEVQEETPPTPPPSGSTLLSLLTDAEVALGELTTIVENMRALIG